MFVSSHDIDEVERLAEATPVREVTTEVDVPDFVIAPAPARPTT